MKNENRTYTEQEARMEEHLILLTEDPHFPEPKDVPFELWHYDGTVKTMFLKVGEGFTEEQGSYIKNKLRPFFTSKLVVGVIKNKKENI